MSNNQKKDRRRDKMNLFLDSVHSLLSKAKELGFSMNTVRRMFPDKFFTGKRYRHGTQGAHGPGVKITPVAYRTPQPPRIRPAFLTLCAGNAQDRRRFRRKYGHTPDALVEIG